MCFHPYLALYFLQVHPYLNEVLQKRFTLVSVVLVKEGGGATLSIFQSVLVLCYKNTATEVVCI